jgi:hypothetical protein
MHLILTGATGLVGASVLHNMLAQESVSRISILSRRPVAMAEGHEKAKVIIHKDYKTYDKALLEELKGAQGCVWAQGVSQNAVSKECIEPTTTPYRSQANEDREYVEITHDYPLAFARAFSTVQSTTPFTFLYVSGEGATQTPGLLTPIFGHVKGQTESALFEFSKQNMMFKIYNVRPGVVDWTKHSEIRPFIPKQEMYKKIVIGATDMLYKSMATPTREMGRVMTELAMNKGEQLGGIVLGMEGTLVTNVALRRMAGLP